MKKEEISRIIKKQRAFFATGKTLSVNYRIVALKRLYAGISKYEQELARALAQDLGKSHYESYMCEIGMVLSEITYMLKHVKGYARERAVRTPLAQFHAKSYQKPSPYGVTLVMSPWNYPVLLTLDPVVDALAAGNTVVVKPSAYSAATSEVLVKLIRECFPEHYVALITGGRAENTFLLEEHFDYIFFTGSPVVGKEVMKKASEHLTPVTLELGGKSPCIVEKTADIKLAAKRIVFGKYLNCGQTCVAPDYVYCEKSIKNVFVQEVKKQIALQYGSDPLENADYGHIINEKHFDRIHGLIDADKVVHGGRCDRETLQIEPTVMADVVLTDAVMQEEIFGPLMPILTFASIDEVIRSVNEREHPLALYLFTQDKRVVHKVMSRCGFGGGCVNDTIIHLATSEMPFGGFGESGMGSYHGKAGFDTFSHHKSIVDKKTWIDLPMRYQPYRSRVNEKLLRTFLH